MVPSNTAWPLETSVWFILALIGMVPAFLSLEKAFENDKQIYVVVGYIVYCILMFPASFWIAA